MLHWWTKRIAAVTVPLLLGAMPAFAQDIYYGLRDWAGPNGGSMNISSFVFRDINANGTYDLGDRVFVNIAVELQTPSGLVASSRTNIGGYANFNASLTQQGAAIAETGVYSFRVVPPPGWSITTGNGEQTIPMSILEGAPGDIVADNLPQPVGLVPHIEIHGRAGEQSDAVIGKNPNGAVVPAHTGDQDRYSIAATPGRWTIGERPLDVGLVPIVLPQNWSDEAGTEGKTIRVGFDDLFVGDELLKVPNGYGGLRWENWVATHGRFYEGEGYINNTVSGEFVAYTSSGHPTATFSEEPFDFVGGYFGVAWSNAEGETLRIRAWRRDTLVHDDEFALSAYGPVYFAADYKSITRLEFATAHYWQAVADDLEFVVRAAER